MKSRINPSTQSGPKGLSNNKCSFLGDENFDQSKKGGGTLVGTKETTSDEALIKKFESKMSSYCLTGPKGAGRGAFVRSEILSKYILINSSSCRMPRSFIKDWCDEIYSYLRKKKIRMPKQRTLTVVFLNSSSAKALNFKYRQKKYATDVLSFEGDGVESLGELVLCPQVLKRQAQEHGLSFRQELGYMLIHGVLHLLGYDHEKNPKEAKIMFQIQDEMFDQLSRHFGIE